MSLQTREWTMTSKRHFSQRSIRELREHEVFQDLLDLSPGLQARVVKASPEELHYCADMVGFRLKNGSNVQFLPFSRLAKGLRAPVRMTPSP